MANTAAQYMQRASILAIQKVVGRSVSIKRFNRFLEVNQVDKEELVYAMGSRAEDILQ